MNSIDLSHTIGPNMPVYPGDPDASLEKIASVQTDGFTDHFLQTGLHVGTHMDAPLHMIANGENMSNIPTAQCMGNGKLIDVRGETRIDADVLENANIQAGDIVLLLTGHSTKFTTPEYYETYPECTEAFAKKAVELGVKIVGMDTPSPDSAPHAVHKILLQAGVLILENLTNVEALLHVPHFEVIALPLKIQADASPVRVIAIQKDA